jgi:zinc transport system substrate-binding protein
MFVLIVSGCGAKTASPGGEATGAASASPAGSAPAEAPTPSATPGKKLTIVATFYPMVEFSKQVAGDLGDVTALVPTGVEPHDWEPSAKDMALIQGADVFVYNGIVEGWAEKALSSASNDKRIVIEASHGLELVEGEAHDHDHGHEGDEAGHEGDEHSHEGEEAGHEGDEHGHEGEEAGYEGENGHEEHDHDHGHGLDPHVWLSPVLAQKQVTAIADAFGQADPVNKEQYRANADAFIGKLKELDQAYRDGLAAVKRKEFVTQHAAFGYLAKEYGLTQVPISGLSPEQEPSPAEMAEVVKFAKTHEVKTIFFETLVDPKIAETIAREVKAKTAVLNPLEGLTQEDLGKGLDYIAMMKQNLEALVTALNE